jgi:general stress protein 26
MATETYGEDVKHLFKLLKEIKYSMLTTVDADGSLRSRPMANCHREEFDGELWFFTRASSHKVSEVERSQQVNLSYAEPGKNNYVSISGTAELVRDKAKCAELWSPVNKAWFPQGLEDPDLALLKVTVEKAEYWDNPASTVVQVAGMAKAMLTGEPEKMGENKKLNFG